MSEPHCDVRCGNGAVCPSHHHTGRAVGGRDRVCYRDTVMGEARLSADAQDNDRDERQSIIPPSAAQESGARDTDGLTTALPTPSFVSLTPTHARTFLAMLYIAYLLRGLAATLAPILAALVAKLCQSRSCCLHSEHDSKENH